MGEGGIGKEERSRIDNFDNAGFKFKRKPKEEIGFVDGQSGSKALVLKVLVANKPSQRGNKDNGNQGNNGRWRIKRLGEKSNLAKGEGHGGGGWILEGNSEKEEVGQKKERGVKAAGAENH